MLGLYRLTVTDGRNRLSTMVTRLGGVGLLGLWSGRPNANHGSRLILLTRMGRLTITKWIPRLTELAVSTSVASTSILTGMPSGGSLDSAACVTNMDRMRRLTRMPRTPRHPRLNREGDLLVSRTYYPD